MIATQYMCQCVCTLTSLFLSIFEESVAKKIKSSFFYTSIFSIIKFIQVGFRRESCLIDSFYTVFTASTLPTFFNTYLDYIEIPTYLLYLTIIFLLFLQFKETKNSFLRKHLFSTHLSVFELCIQIICMQFVSFKSSNMRLRGVKQPGLADWEFFTKMGRYNLWFWQKFGYTEILEPNIQIRRKYSFKQEQFSPGLKDSDSDFFFLRKIPIPILVLSVLVFK